MRRWIWVTMPQCQFGLVDEGGKIGYAAPIAQQVTGWRTMDAVAYFQRRGARVIRLGP